MAISRSFLLLIPVVILLYACEINTQSDPFRPAEDENKVECEFVETLDMPLPYSLTHIGTISSDNRISNFQMVSQEVGYGLGSKVKGGYPFVVKTNDGGSTWTEFSPNTAHYPISLFFMDESTGFITVQDITGCPNDCKNKTVILKTIDGGQNWEEVSYPNLKGILYHLQADNDGNLFANLFTPEKVTLVKSTDTGATFEKLYESEDYGFSDVRFSFTIQNDLIYANGKEDRLFVIDPDGSVLEILHTGASNSVTGLTILSQEIFLLSTSNTLRMTRDAGRTWAIIREGGAQIIEAKVKEEDKVEVLILNTQGYCPTDVVQAIDVFAYTRDSGLNWDDGGASENTSLSLSTPFPKKTAPSGLISIENKLYRVSQ